MGSFFSKPMSYVPKYILKRLVPKDAVTKVENGVKVKAINVISPIPLSQLPGNPLDEIDLALDGKEMSREEKAKVTVEVNGDTYPLENLRDAGDVAIGAEMIFFFETDAYNSGDEVTAKLSIPIANTELEFTRKIQ